MNEKVRVTTTRPVLFEGKPQTEFETTELHRRELKTRGLIAAPAGAAAPKGPSADAKPGEKFIAGKAADVIAAIEGADKALLAEALEAEKAKGDKARSTVVDALTAAVNG